MKGRALLFHVMLKSGAHFRKLPIHALQTGDKPLLPHFSLSDLQLWDCFSYRPIVTVWDYLYQHECVCILRNKARVNGTYIFTVDWLPDNQESPGFVLQPDQNKCAHVIELETGQLAALPTNRILWKDGYFIGNDPTAEKKGYLTDEEVWQAESCEKWSVAESNNHLYTHDNDEYDLVALASGLGGPLKDVKEEHLNKI